MRKQINQVKEFNDAFNIPYSEKPVLTDLKMQELRVNLLKEEIEELAAAQITVNRPNISGSLELLRQVNAGRNQTLSNDGH